MTAAAGTMLALASDHTIGDPTSTGPEKAKALPERTASWIAAGVGLGAAAGGLVAIMLANDESK